MKDDVRRGVGYTLTLLGLVGGCKIDNSLSGQNGGDIALTAGDFDDVQAPFNRLDVATDRYDGVISTATWDSGYDPGAVGLKVEGLLGGEAELTKYGRLIVASGTKGLGGRAYNSTLDDNQFVIDPAVAERVANYVERGNVLMCTDWSYDLIEVAFPDLIDFFGEDTTFDDAQRGEIGEISGVVEAESLKTLLGTDTLSLNYDFSNWSVVTGVSEEVEVLVRGDAVVRTGTGSGAEEVTGVPLLLRAPIGNNGGLVVFSSFHLDAQTPGMIDQLIPFLVGSLEKADPTVAPIGQE